ncbi:palmitoyl-acyl carrier protein thioesterase, chloroplastic-like [Iris pallida]|uniref:Acyl-[acyl-carrier-protein] hydrolase n=1 Tax=Iris pallida TaxID=29817 RepID=A0AAX6EEN3_IRIPA|nr:palmitoyl-acyl carrier protein thioesterase, chloroplastic-like [Iris pallida]
MVASVSASAFFPVPSSSSSSSSSSLTGSAKPSSISLGKGPDSLYVRGLMAKPASSSGSLQVKVNAQAATRVNGSKVGLKTDTNKLEDAPFIPSSAPRTFYNQLPDWSVLLAAITTIFLAAEKQWTLIDWKPRRPDMLSDAFGLGKIIENGLLYRQNFSIRSYEIGADQTASIETLMNHLQETALNHVKCAGLLGNGFGSTPEMSKMNLIWVVTKMQVLVEHYPSWGDVIEVDTWAAASGKNGMRRDWHVRDWQTGQTIMRASSNWVMMNKNTRRLSKFPEEVRAEIEPYFMERAPVIDDDNRKLPKLDDDTADHVRNGLTPRWSDLDVNQHVNNVKYIGWILEVDLSCMICSTGWVGGIVQRLYLSLCHCI